MNFPDWIVWVYIPTAIVLALYWNAHDLLHKERHRRITEGRQWATRVRRLEDKAQALPELPMLLPLPKIAIEPRELN